MLKESTNNVVIEGILSEVDLKETSYTKEGQKVDAIGGTIKVKVTQEIEGETRELDIPISMFSGKMTKKGTINPSYANIKKVIEEFNSIAQVGEDAADRVRITGAKITMNEYYTPDGKLVSFPRISASFVNKIRATDCVPKATWDADVYIGKIGFKTDKDGVETETFEILGVSIGYKGDADLIPMITNRSNIANALNTTYSKGDTIALAGKLNFCSKTETIIEKAEIGDDIEKTRTTFVSEVVITSKMPRDVEAYDTADIQEALKQRTARLEAAKASAAAKQGSEKKAPSAGKGNDVDLGF